MVTIDRIPIPIQTKFEHSINFDGSAFHYAHSVQIQKIAFPNVCIQKSAGKKNKKQIQIDQQIGKCCSNSSFKKMIQLI